MIRRISLGALMLASLFPLAVCGCQSGGGPQFLQANKLVSAFSSMTNRAPGGQTEPEIVVGNDETGAEQDEPSDW